MKRLLTTSLFLFSFSILTFAQLSTVALTGTVSGPDGVLPGASVNVKDNKTNKEITVTSGSDGQFRVPNLEIGNYTVTVTASGFKTFNAEQVRLEIGKDYSLPVSLEIGAVSETVTVTAGTDIINTTDAQQNGIVSNRQIEQLPLLTRSPLGFIPLQAGVSSNPSQNSTINGVRTSGTNITIEGVNVQDNFIRSNATDFSPARPLVDEIEEFTVTGQANADKGFGAAQVQFPIRRGGNRYTGSVYDYNRNSKFAANNFSNNAGGVRRPFRNRNDFGGRFQGPLPFLNFGEGGPVTTTGKDKLFFFFFYQKTIDIIPTSDLQTVLTSQARNGQFTYNAGCTLPFAANDPNNASRCPQGINPGQLVTVNLFNPALGTGITGVNPTINSRILALLPGGNSTEAGDGRVTTGYRFLQNSNAEQTNYTTRIDYNINDRNSIKGIYRYVYQTVQRSDVDTGFNVNPIADQPSNNPFLSVGLVSSINNNFANEVQGGFSFSSPFFLRNDSTPTSFLSSGLINNPEVAFLNQGRTAKAYNLQDNATLTLGNHNIRFGGQVQAIRINSFNFAGTAPTYTLAVGTATPQITTAQFLNNTLFPGTVTANQRAGGNSLLALLGGIISSSTQTFNATTQNQGYTPGASNSRRFENENYGLYVSDQWRIRRNLTVNIGTRYDIYGAIRNPQGLFLEPQITDTNNPIASILNPNGRYQFVGGNAGTANQFFKTDYNNFGPNISFAYSPSSDRSFGKYLLGENRTTIRGGFRISYINDEFVASANNAGAGNAGLSSSPSFTNLNFRANALPGVAAPTFIQTPDRTFAVNNAQSGSNFGTVYAIDPNVQTSSVKEYSLGIQRELGFNTALEIRYVGSHSGNLLRAIDLNQIDIRSNGFLSDFNRARANFQLTGNAACVTAGCQALTVFPNLASGGLLTNATITGQLVAGTPADLALVYIQNGLTGNVRFLPNQNTGVVDYLANLGRSTYNSLQVEVRRRFAQGFQLQANYTFSKNLTNSQGAQTNGTGDTQNRFDPLLDNSNPSLEYSRALSDQTHKFNVNGVYELPFGRGKSFFSNSSVANTLLGGFAVSGILQIGSGSPITFVDARGTLNRAGRSNRQTALTNLTKKN